MVFELIACFFLGYATSKGVDALTDWIWDWMWKPTTEVKMECPKCKGWMIEGAIVTPQGQIWAWRCVPCGNIFDEVMEANKGKQPRGDRDFYTRVKTVKI